MFIFSTPELTRNLFSSQTRNLCQLKTTVFLHWCLKCAVTLEKFQVILCKSPSLSKVHFIMWHQDTYASHHFCFIGRTLLTLMLMEQQVLYCFDDYRGHHRKGIAIYTASKVNLHLKKLWFHSTKCIFEHYRKVQTRKF